MQTSHWFHQQLQASTEGFLWAVEQISEERHYQQPRPNRWSVARVVYHMQCYDQRIGLPTLQQWQGGPCPVVGSQEEDAAVEEQHWNNGTGHEMPVMLATFKHLRAEQLALIQQFPASAWKDERAAIWGLVTLHWAVTKTYQHTLEHTDELLRAYLWWK